MFSQVTRKQGIDFNIIYGSIRELQQKFFGNLVISFDGEEKDIAAVIEENYKDLEIIPMIAQQTPRVLQDVAASIINNGIAGQAGYDPANAPIYLEDGHDNSILPYVNIFASRAEDADNKIYLKIVELYQSEPVSKAIEKETKGGSILSQVPKEQLFEAFESLKVVE